MNVKKYALDSAFRRDMERCLAGWKKLLRFPSISADPAHRADCRACAKWLSAEIAAMGFRSRVLATPGNPVVFAERPGAAGAPTVLFYGHYDVQPVDPLDQWESPPFAPELRGNRLHGRGAQDNKGQLWYVLKAIEALIGLDAPLPTIKVFIEGEEECGSAGTNAAVDSWAKLLRADVMLVTDSGRPTAKDPCITLGLRGIVSLSVTLSGPLRDLHSGSHGGVAPNPAAALARLLASLHDGDGRIAVEGYYDDVIEPTPRERRLAGAAPIRAAAYRAQTGVPPIAGEPDFTPVERIGFRPTIEINGMHSGYDGPGMKTIIPSSATAKLTSRLVADQAPHRCLTAIVRHLRRHAPRGLRLDIRDPNEAGSPLRISPDSPLQDLAREVLLEVSGRPVVYKWVGGSIPVLVKLAKVSGAEPLICGTGLEADRIHAPNESFSIPQFREGFLYAGLLLARLGLQPASAFSR